MALLDGFVHHALRGAKLFGHIHKAPGDKQISLSIENLEVAAKDLRSWDNTESGIVPYEICMGRLYHEGQRRNDGND